MPKISKTKRELRELLRHMPPLYHKLPNEDFSYKKSEVLAWVVKSPRALAYLWDGIAQSKEIVYDKATGKWHGVEWEKDE